MKTDIASYAYFDRYGVEKSPLPPPSGKMRKNDLPQWPCAWQGEFETEHKTDETFTN